MAYRRDGLDAHVRDNIIKRVHSSFTLFNPIFYFLGLATPDGRNNLGRPGTNAVFGGMLNTQAQMKTQLGSVSRHVRYVKAEPDDGSYMAFGGSTPTASGFAEDNFGTAEMRWTEIREPMKLRVHTLQMASGELAVQSVVDDSMNPIWERFVKRVNAGLWSGSLTQAQQNKTLWEDGFLGVTHQLTTNNFLGRVDRSVETALNPLNIAAATQLPSTLIDLDIISKVHTGFTDELSADIVGLTGKASNSVGPTCWITTPSLWQALRQQSEGDYQIYENGIPDSGLSGFKWPIIKRDNSYITYDPNCPSGEMYGLNLDTWVVEIQSGMNFTWSGFTRKDRTEEGGGAYEWGNFEVQMRLTCEEPWNNVRISGLTAT